MNRNEFINKLEASIDAICNDFCIDKDYFIENSIILADGALLLGGYIDETNNIDMICSDEIYDKITIPEKNCLYLCGKYKRFNDICEISFYNICDGPFDNNIIKMKDILLDTVDINGKMVYYQNRERAIWTEIPLINEWVHVKRNKLESLLKIKDKILEENKHGQ